MNKSELIQAMAEKTGSTKKDAGTSLDAFIEIVMEITKKDDKVKLVGFGTFGMKERASRTGRNPRDPGQAIEIPAAKVPYFKPGKLFKETLNR